MRPRSWLALVCVAAFGLIGWLSRAEQKPAELVHWERVTDGVYRSKIGPHGYAIVAEKKAILIDATVPPDAVRELGVDTIAGVYLTHHHRDTAAFTAEYRKKKVDVYAPRESVEWLDPKAVAKFWAESIPLRNSRTTYFVLPEGVEGVRFEVTEAAPILLGPWTITPIATPGHSRDHYAYHAKRTAADRTTDIVFCGDAFCTPGKLWTPYTTDWDHWTDAGLKPTAESLRKLAKLNADFLCPAHGPVFTGDTRKALADTAAAVEEAAFQKSFERFSKERLKDAPKYDFLVPKEQIASGGEKPWARVSAQLWITGNTYVLKAKDGNAILVLDPWGQRSADQIEKLRKDEKLGAVEVVAFSHAHYDHFDGLYVMDARDRCEVWSLDTVAVPLKEPLRFRAPFLDARPIRFTKELKDGETITWGGYTFKFHHLPGQSWFTSGIEATIDGKRCVFTADNFFHQDQFSGSGGWMGLNRSSPAVYGTSAKKVLDIAPEWVLAEHGGPYVFGAEDYRRRVRWADAAGKACDALCVSGRHLRDWTPHRVVVDPQLVRVKRGEQAAVKVTVEGTGPAAETVGITLQGRGRFTDIQKTFEVRSGERTAHEFALDCRAWLVGRHIFVLRAEDKFGADPVDAFVAIDVIEP